MKPMSILAVLLVLAAAVLGILEIAGSRELGLAAIAAAVLSLHDRK